MSDKKNDFDVALKQSLGADDAAYIDAQLDIQGYYNEAFESLSGPGKWLYRMTWAGIIIFGVGLIVCVWKMFGADNLRAQIIFASFAVMFNSAQIALKMWYNMRLNRQAIMREIKRLHLAVARNG